MMIGVCPSLARVLQTSDQVAAGQVCEEEIGLSMVYLFMNKCNIVSC